MNRILTLVLDGNIPRSPWTGSALHPQANLRAHRQHSATGVNRNTLQHEPSSALALNSAQTRRNACTHGIFDHHGGSEARPRANLAQVGPHAVTTTHATAGKNLVANNIRDQHR
jgi:hypothetical protein